MNYKLKIDKSITAQFPEYATFVIYAEGLENKTSNEFCTNLLRIAEREHRAAFGTEKPSFHTHIAAWAQAYKSFGTKPSKYPCSVEALLKRIVKAQDLPAINPAVDLYNAVSIRYVLPVGGEDWDCLTSDLVLKTATGEEPFITFENGEEVVTYPEPGEVIWVDKSGVTCRRWNWRQCRRTQVTADTRNAYFVLDSLPPYSMEHLTAAGEELMENLNKYSPNCTLSQEILNADNLG
jgi:DNA/RNA-binding domain of Phe-tRNA-synthetase-like protein